jgi:hypothetical protein
VEVNVSRTYQVLNNASSEPVSTIKDFTSASDFMFPPKQRRWASHALKKFAIAFENIFSLKSYLLGCDTAQSGRSSPKFRRNVLPPSSGPKLRLSKHQQEESTKKIEPFLEYFFEVQACKGPQRKKIETRS